jgi:hypothetical protein
MTFVVCVVDHNYLRHLFKTGGACSTRDNSWKMRKASFHREEDTLFYTKNIAVVVSNALCDFFLTFCTSCDVTCLHMLRSFASSLPLSYWLTGRYFCSVFRFTITSESFYADTGISEISFRYRVVRLGLIRMRRDTGKLKKWNYSLYAPWKHTEAKWRVQPELNLAPDGGETFRWTEKFLCPL